MKMKSLTLGLLVLIGLGCQPSDALRVPVPAGIEASSQLQNAAGAAGVFNGAKGQLFSAIGGELLSYTTLLTDEYTFADFTNAATGANIDARFTTLTSGGFYQWGDGTWGDLLRARSSLLIAIPGLRQYETGGQRSMIGEAYALVGYSEVFLAESYCAGTPLDIVLPGGGIQYGTPLTTDSLLEVAIEHFDSAAAEASGNDSVASLASVGHGRALLDLGNYSAAAAAVANVPTAFVYNIVNEPNLDGAPYTPNFYAESYQYSFLRINNVADREGQNGLNYVSAHDPRLGLDSSMANGDGGTWYFPTKFEDNLAYIPLATGVEAALITAEADLQTSASAWLTDINTLRAAAPNTYLALSSGLVSLGDPGTDTGRVSLMFRERAFWLFGTGTRLGDLRRLVRSYGRSQSEVYPTGTYTNGTNPNLPFPLPIYGTDVDLTLPTSASGLTITNPSYHGCLVPTSTA